MTLALWCVLVAALMPAVLTGLAKSGGHFDNRSPRTAAETLQGWHRRAHGAHLNGYEAFPFFAAAVIVAEMKGGPRGLVEGLAIAFVIARILYAAAYISDRATLRSAIWTVGFLLTIAIFVSPLWR